MKDDPILLEREGRVATVTFHRPECLNAFLSSMYQELHSLVGDLERDETVRVVILTGSGRAFCAGDDLKELEARGSWAHDREAIRTVLDRLQDITRRIARGRNIYLAAVNGVAAGFGAELALSCDVRLGSESASFLFPEVRRGLFVTNGVTHLLPRIAGLGRAMELLLSGAPIDAENAARVGLLGRVVPGDELLREAKALGRQIAQNAPQSVRLTKRALRLGVEGDLEGALRQEIDFALECFEGGAHKEGARAFVEKRDPEFG
jgi:enoyl-CoA hydratase/carnithine racemase